MPASSTMAVPSFFIEDSLETPSIIFQKAQNEVKEFRRQLPHPLEGGKRRGKI